MTPLADNIAEEPAHTDAELTVMTGALVTVTPVVFDLTQPAAEVPVTVYVVLETGDTDKLEPVAPVFHVYVEAPEAVKLAVEPEQIVAELTLTEGNALTVTLATTVLAQPAALVPVTE